MANASSTTQKLKTYMKNELNVDFDIDASTTCKMANDASQTMKNINIQGGKNITLSQLSKLQNLCYAQQVLNNEQFNQLSAKAQDDIQNTAKQEGGLSVNVNDTTQDIEKKVENKFDLKTKLNMRKDCFNKVKAPQSMTDINIQDSLNIDLTQQSDIYNKCMFDTAASIGVTQATAADTSTKSQSTLDQKGFDPIGSLLSLGASGALLSLGGPLLILIISSGLSIAMSAMGGKKGDTTGVEGVEGMNGTNYYDLPSQQQGYATYGGGKRKWLKWLAIAIGLVIGYYVIKYILRKYQEGFDSVPLDISEGENRYQAYNSDYIKHKEKRKFIRPVGYKAYNEASYYEPNIGAEPLIDYPTTVLPQYLERHL